MYRSLRAAQWKTMGAWQTWTLASWSGDRISSAAQASHPPARYAVVLGPYNHPHTFGNAHSFTGSLHQ